MPPHAITLLTPMLDITDAHGPTAFCVGSAHLHGVNRHTATLRDGLDASLLNDEACPRGLSVFSPLLKRGDVLLFDYNTMHRAAPNHSPQTRALLYVTFSRNWFKDVGNFDAGLRRSGSNPRVRYTKRSCASCAIIGCRSLAKRCGCCRAKSRQGGSGSIGFFGGHSS
jgi:ectoine hydroxylase-related dioxygenase (phytanoyl-CoA dioxygenase family)